MNLRHVAAIILWVLAATTCQSSASAQVSKLQIPFNLRGNVVILPVRIGDSEDGVLGNCVLRHFNVIFDYQNAKLYLKPNSFFREPF